MTLPTYATREDVKSALDFKETARNNVQVDRALESATRYIDDMCHRVFHPRLQTIRWDWPQDRYGPTWKLYLNQHDLISITSMTIAGVTIDSADRLLYPDDGPPYTRLELDRDATQLYERGDTGQKPISITGLFGYRDDETAVGELTAELGASESATAAVSFTTARVGVGDVLRVDSERIVVAARTMVDSTQDLQADLGEVNSAVTVAVSNGTAFSVEQIILVDSERMLVVDVAGNNLTVKRAWDGSVLAPHSSGASIYTLTGMDTERAQLGTTLAVHPTGTTIYRYDPPPLVRQLCIAEAIDKVLQEQAGYTRTSGSGENERETRAGALRMLRDDVYNAHGRKARMRAV